ncbi:MAG: DUF4163 domain-containing protein [Desulfovibrio sp.]|nr:DUF4163 domain-containing protein [Desulfovibrio sp.]
MNYRGVAVLLLLFFFSVPYISFAGTVDIGKAEWAELMKNPEFKDAERRLGEAYKAAATSRSKKEKNKLRDAQRAWNARREQTAFEQFGKGTPGYIRFFIDEADKRIAELQSGRVRQDTASEGKADGVRQDTATDGKADGGKGSDFSIRSSRQYPGLSLEITVTYPQGLGKAADAAVEQAAKVIFDETVASYEKAAAEQVVASSGTSRELPGWESVTSYTLFHPSARYASILFSTRGYSGGAHPHYLYKAFTYDLATGKELTLVDVLPVNIPAALAQRIVKDVLRQKKERNAAVGGTGDEKNYVDLTMDRILLTPAGMRVVYAPYEMGSYAEGEYIVNIPKQELLKMGADASLWQ